MPYSLVRACITTAHGKFNPNIRARDFAQQRWGSEEARNIEMMTRATSSPAMTSVAGWAAELATVTSAFLRALTPISAGADLLSRALTLEFAGAAKINLPNVSVALADFVKAGAPIPIVSGATGVSASLEPFKFAVITVLTREVVEGGNAETLMKQVLLDSTGPALDRRLFDSNAAVADTRPAGLLYGKTALTPSADTDKAQAMVADLSALAEAVAPYAGNGQIVFIAAAKQSVAISIGLPRDFTYPLLTSTSLASGTVIAVAIPAIVSALGAVPLLDESKVASWHSDDAPQAIASGTMATPITASFQTDMIGLRMRWPICWALRNANAIAFINAAGWP
jgi:hypothetical protein